MAKAKKRIAARKKSSKRGKTSAKPMRKKMAKRAAPKKSKSKVRRAKMSAPKKKRSPKTAVRKAPTQVLEAPVETTIIDPIEKPVPGVVVVAEYESVRTATPIAPDGESGSGQGTSPGTIEPRAA
jgi:hypothetical protein